LRRSSLSTSAAKGFLKELQEIKEEASVETNHNRHSSTTPNAFGKASTSRTGGAGGFSTSAGANPWEYELPLAVRLYPDPKLRAPNATVTEFDDKLAEFAKHMFKVMYETDGIGLAAPQVGVNVKLMVYNPTGEASETSEEVVFINPKVVNKSKGQTLFEEGCLSFPDIMGDVKRPKSVTIEAKDLQGKTIRLDLDGLEARIFQHELDHLDGTLFHDKMAPQVFRSVKDELLALEQKFERENPGVEYQSI
jgi:peptide deformylase